MTESLILNKLDRLEVQMDRMIKTVELIAVQEVRINTLASQVAELWEKRDEDFGSNGIITQVKNWQQSCPRDAIKETLTAQWAITKNSVNQQWTVIGLLSTIICGIVLKMLKVV